MKQTGKAPRLTPMQERFALEYARVSNGALAARLAGYSERSARQQAHKLLTSDDVLARVKQLQIEWHEQQVAAIRSLVSPAIEALGEIVATGGGRGAQARVLAACSLLDRAGFKPLDRIEAKTAASITVVLGHDDMAL